MTYMQLRQGCAFIDVPEKIRKLVPSKYSMEGISDEEGRKIAIVIKEPGHLEIVYRDEDLLQSDADLMESIIAPSLKSMEEVL